MSEVSSGPGTGEMVVPVEHDTGWSGFIWLALTVVSFAMIGGVAYRPELDGWQGVALAVLPWLMFVASLVFFGRSLVRLPRFIKWSAVGVAIGSWSLIMFSDDRYSVLTFVMYAMCFSTGPRIGIALAGVVSAAWGAAWLATGAPIWTLAMPIGVFIVGTLISLSMEQAEKLTNAQADLIRQLTETQRDLATSERAKGMLEERARMAAEIHDTLAQGFTSIVLQSRAAQRADGVGQADRLTLIEETAQENLVATRRLVDAVSPPELDRASLPDALDRQLQVALPADIRSQLRVVGRPRPVAGSVEITLLRAAQEALLNVRTHAEAQRVDMTLSYFDDAVALDVRDDGVGFTPGSVTDRGSLTGGQGLELLAGRARSLAGEFTIEPGEGGGSVVSILLPALAP